MAHTKGPWIHELESTDSFSINSDGDDWKAIATVESNFLGARQVGGREAESNARLISAAPELLDALRSVHECLSAGRMSDAGDIIRSAIAKATGKAG